MIPSLPAQAAQYFWGDDLNDLDLEKHQSYIVQTLLEKGNAESIRWLFMHVGREQIREMLPHLKLSPKSSNFWRLYLS